MADDSILGTNPCGARSFAPAVPASGAPSALADIARGGYYLVSSVDALFKLAKSGGTAVAALATTQPAANAINATVFLPAGQVVPINVSDRAAQYSVVSINASTGTLYISGPMITP